MSPPRDLSEAFDEEVVARARQGHEDAYGELVRRHRRSIYSLLYHLVGDHDLAEDLMAETFVKAFDGLDSHHADSKFSSWLLKIANNLGVDHLRREQRLKRRGFGTVPLEPTPDTSCPRRRRALELRAAVSNTPTPMPRYGRAAAPALAEALRGMKENYSTCLVLREIEGRSYDDIADLLDVRVGTVGTWLSRARKELRATLDPLRHALLASSPTPS